MYVLGWMMLSLLNLHIWYTYVNQAVHSCINICCSILSGSHATLHASGRELWATATYYSHLCKVQMRWSTYVRMYVCMSMVLTLGRCRYVSLVVLHECVWRVLWRTQWCLVQTHICSQAFPVDFTNCLNVQIYSFSLVTAGLTNNIVYWCMPT